jgi:hypothetical protein
MELILSKGEQLNLSESFAGCSLQCRTGSCWLTRKGDSRDLILRPGGDIDVSGCCVIVTALTIVHLRVARQNKLSGAAGFPGECFGGIRQANYIVRERSVNRDRDRPAIGPD